MEIYTTEIITDYEPYMNFVNEFFIEVSKDEMIINKIAKKDISFEILFIDNNEYANIHFKNGLITGGLGNYKDGEVDLKLRMSTSTFHKIMTGATNPLKAMNNNEFTVKGNVSKAMSLLPIFKLMTHSYKNILDKHPHAIPKTT